MARKTLAVLSVVTGLALVVAGCGSTSEVGGAGFGTQICGDSGATQPRYQAPFAPIPGGANTLSGAGSSFVAPMMADWTKAYSEQAQVQVSYQSVGSGAGVAQIQAGTVDFGASDTGISEAETAKAKGPVQQIPLLLGAVVPAYHLNGVPEGLRFTGDVLGKIFAGAITKWSDPALTALNPGVKLPDEPIAVVHRSDGSGTTGIWTDYLSKVSPDWVRKLGGATTAQGKDVAWPAGIGGKGNEGVAGAVSQTEGSLGYLELQYALAQQITYGQVQNKAGKFIQPCVATVIRAVNGVTFPPNLNTSLTDGTAADAYPIAGTTYALVYQNQTDPAHAVALVNFLSWVLSAGQDRNPALNYAPLGPGLQRLSVEALKKVTVNGAPIVPVAQ
ncbi:MAG: phosphate ABC transporter substrate-binding protein PstS [Actinomycetota bacterium]|nr:phosphate ABC transporter substrate-binding protein PstS [Actinomycetota bacterium]